MKKLIIITVIIVLAYIFICTRWSKPLLKYKPLHGLYRILLRERSTRIANQFRSITTRMGINTQTILDFGCGFGGVSKELSNSGSVVISVDIENQSIYDLPRFVQIYPDREITSILFPVIREISRSDYVDVILSSYCFHHIQKDKHASLIYQFLSLSPVVVLLEEHPRMNLACRFLNGEMLTHANAHMEIGQWQQHITSMGLRVQTYSFSDDEFAIVITR